MTSTGAPNIAGKVMTVLGAVDPDVLGVTLTHEHLFIDLRKTHLPYRKFLVQDGRLVADPPDDDFPATELHQWEAKLDLSNMQLARNVAPISDNYFLDDEDLAVREVAEYKRHGGNSIVEMTSIGIKRDPEALRRVSEQTGVHIVMGTAYYQRVYHPDDMDSRTVEQLTDVIVRDVTVGVRETGVRSGIVGEVGINGGPLTDNELKSMRAAARAARLTGAPVCVHLGGVGAEKHRMLDIAADEGVDLERVIMGHCDELVDDMPLLYELLERGAYVAFDNLGREPEVVTPSRTAMIAQAIPGIIEAGYVDRVLISQDVCWKMHLKAYGGFGYSFLLERFIPGLKTLGVTDSQVHTMMVENARRILTFTAPQQ